MVIKGTICKKKKKEKKRKSVQYIEANTLTSYPWHIQVQSFRASGVNMDTFLVLWAASTDC